MVALSESLRDSLDALFSPLQERLSRLETVIVATRRSRRRRRRVSSSSSDGEYSGEDGGRHVSRRSVSRALGRQLDKGSRRMMPPKIISAVDPRAAILYCATRALVSTAV